MNSIQRIISLCALFALAAASLIHTQAEAAQPSDRLMAPSTRGYLSIKDINKLHELWLQTQMGQLAQDEAMKPFVEDMKRQLRSKITGVRNKLGLELADLKNVAGGEIALGLVERENDRAAIALIVDVTGRRKQLDSLLKKIDKELTKKRKATKALAEKSGVEITTYQIPAKKEPDVLRTAVFFVKENMLCATDSPDEAEEMLRRFGGKSEGLSSVQPYQETMRRCSKEAKGLQPELRWFVDPFGYARAVRSLAPKDRKQYGKNYVNILREQGFDAIQGLGGFVNLAVAGSYELLHRTSVYAPPISGEPEKYRLAMRMMKFPNRKDMTAHKWLPRKLATYRTFNCDLSSAFEYFDTLFDAIAGYEEAFAGVLEGLERDPYGPQVDVRKDFVAHLGERVILVTDYEVPITPKCERFMIVVELTNEEAVAETVEKFMKSDPHASQTDFEGKVVWEIQEVEEDVMEIDITSSDLDLLETVQETASQEVASNSQSEASAVCVTADHLFIASHASFLKDVLANDEEQDRLRNTADYREVERRLSRLLPGNNSVKSFMRMDEAFRPVYELLRQGKMPESETLLGRLLNRLLTPPDDEEEGILREQKIDGSQLPEFEMVRRYFGPAGTVIRSEEDGWFVVGASLNKLSPQARIPANTTADKGKLR
ncbi:MAG: DUF3352 domain-containing protein [Pirellulales bacterium]|nr:DUF3352 domain-containing protein [Pirellulales bacterium]